MVSDVMEDYLKALYTLQLRTSPPIPPSTLATELDRTPATVSSMLDTLEECELIDRKKYHGATLTQRGETRALETIRRHRLLETYLVEYLDFSWSEVHAEAERLEHHISELFTDRVATALDEPEVDPHGDPIPRADLRHPGSHEELSLAECDVGETVYVVRVRDRSQEELEYLAASGIRPGALLSITDRAPFGMTTVNIHTEGQQNASESSDTQSLPEQISEAIFVQAQPEAGSETSSEVNKVYE
jgi:Mn-dependent transcriptional regulator